MSDLLNYIFQTQKPFQDEVKIYALYDKLQRLQNTNPSAYQPSINAWKNALLAAAKEGLLPSSTKSRPNSLRQDCSSYRFVMSTGDQLVKALYSEEYGYPQSLALVLADAAHPGELIPLSEFLKSETSIYSETWIPGIPSLGDIIWWSWSQVKQASQALIRDPGHLQYGLPEAEWVVPSNIEETADTFLRILENQFYAQSSMVHTQSTLRAALAEELPLSHFDLNILLKYLSRDRPRLTYDISLRRFPEPILKLGTPPSPITEEDVAIASIKSSLLSLETRIAALEEQISITERLLPTQVAQKQLSAAKITLKRKHVALKATEKYSDNALQLQNVLHAIDVAKDNVAMMQAIKTNAALIRDLNLRSRGAEHVLKIVDDLNDQISNVEDVSNLLNEPGLASDVDSLDVEDEFNRLIEQEKERAEKLQQEKEAKQLAKRLDELHEQRKHLKEPSFNQATASTSSPHLDDEAVEEDRLAVENLEIQ